jgi:hypothetical protein
MASFLGQNGLALVAVAVAGIALWQQHTTRVDLERRIDALANRPVPARGPATPPAAPSADPWACRGKLDPDAIRAVVGQHGDEVFACYTERLATAPELIGGVGLKLRIDAKGAVVATAAEGTLKDDTVIACITRGARSWRFPPPSEGDCAVVQAPFAFSPPGREAPKPPTPPGR